MKIAWLALAGICLSTAAPVVAGEPARNPAAASDEAPAAPDFAALGETFGKMFPVAEPLSAEAEARLPAAHEVADLLFPPGIFAKVLNGSMGDMFHKLGAIMAPTPVATVAKLTGVSEDDLADVDPADLAQAVAALDPAAEQRGTAQMEAMTTWLTGVMNKAEPLYLDGYAKAFAARFTAEQLADLKTFFQTPSGASFASQFVLIGTDPQVTGKLREVMPLLASDMPAMIEGAQSAVAALPPERYFGDLDAKEKTRLARLLGRSVADLEASSAAAQAGVSADAAGAFDDEDQSGADAADEVN